jgi:two-component system, cell cycle sensor histidine kinase and response regulator CckA
MMQNGRILIVDDEKQVRSLIRRVLFRHGFEMVEAADGREALEILHASGGTIDVVVSDLQMPGMGGGALIGELKRQFPTIRVLLLSSEPDGPGLPACDAVMQKPFAPSELAAAVLRLRKGREGV